MERDHYPFLLLYVVNSCVRTQPPHYVPNQRSIHQYLNKWVYSPLMVSIEQFHSVTIFVKGLGKGEHITVLQFSWIQRVTICRGMWVAMYRCIWYLRPSDQANTALSLMAMKWPSMHFRVACAFDLSVCWTNKVGLGGERSQTCRYTTPYCIRRYNMTAIGSFAKY
jgi:hypothetical protein